MTANLSVVFFVLELHRRRLIYHDDEAAVQNKQRRNRNVIYQQCAAGASLVRRLDPEKHKHNRKQWLALQG